MSSPFSLKRMLEVSLLLSGLSVAMQATAFSSVIAYGDSLSDNGNLFAATGSPAAPYYQGRRSNGPVAVEQLATTLGVPLLDFAWIGATTGIGNYADGGTPTTTGAHALPGMQTEFAMTQASLSPYLASGLFVVWGGPNDFLAPSPLDTTPQAVVTRAVGDIVGIVTSLKSLGASNILVPGMPDLGLTPYFRSLGSTAAANASLVSDAFNAALSSSLPSGVRFYDTATAQRAIAANPGAYGFTNVTDPCFNGTTTCANPAQYFYFDDFHPTTATHGIIARGFEAAVVPLPPSVVLMLGGIAALMTRAFGRQRRRPV